MATDSNRSEKVEEKKLIVRVRVTDSQKGRKNYHKWLKTYVRYRTETI